MCQVSRVLYILHLYAHMLNIFEMFKSLVHMQYKGIHLLNILCEHFAGQKVRKKGVKGGIYTAYVLLGIV